MPVTPVLKIVRLQANLEVKLTKTKGNLTWDPILQRDPCKQISIPLLSPTDASEDSRSACRNPSAVLALGLHGLSVQKVSAGHEKQKQIKSLVSFVM